ncbi:hypothetical protein YC2023_015691 [Brassica napus]
MMGKKKESEPEVVLLAAAPPTPHLAPPVATGTGSAGPTVRIYIEQFEPDPDVSKHDVDAQIALKLINFMGFQRKINWEMFRRKRDVTFRGKLHVTLSM